MIPPQMLRSLISSDEDYTVYLPIIYFFFFFICFLLFRLSQRFHIADDSPSNTRLNLDERPSAAFSPVSIPFKVSVSCGYDSLVEGIALEFECFERCSVQYFWGVGTNLLAHLILGTNGVTSQRHVSSSYQILSQLSSNSISADEPLSFSPGKHQLKVSPNMELNLGSPPRKTVPLVVLCTVSCHPTPSNSNSNSNSNSTSTSTSTSTSKIVNLLTVFHIKDEHCTETSRKLNELISLRNGDHVMPIYGEWLPLYRYYHGDETSQCVVCQEKQVSMILLPCRHACLCDTCSSNIFDKCPMCRSFVTSVAVIQ